MGKYTIHYACGHDVQVELFGPWRERSERIAYMQQQKCPDCKKADAEAKRNERMEHIRMEAAGFPALDGTEKQVAWALDIRQRWMDEVRAKLESNGSTWDESLQRWEASSDEKKAKLLSLPVDTDLCCKFAHIITQTSAKFFIDNRNL